jgi:50S ribosomal subunit-associated GTPase HflX
MKFHETAVQEEAIAVGIVRKKSERALVREQMQELIQLADTAGVGVRHTILQEREQVDPATFIGPGKASEIARTVTEEKISAVIFDDDLSPVQVRNLERIIPCKIIDRSGLILDIFALRAKTKEAMTQVELAQLQYMLPRLTRQWTHLSKQYGGVGTKGPGETQIETDRRAIRRRISILRDKLDRISKEREVQRENRKEMIRVALVGYTNAGKSTLLRHFSGADVLVEDRLFATLDTTVRTVLLGESKKFFSPTRSGLSANCRRTWSPPSGARSRKCRKPISFSMSSTSAIRSFTTTSPSSTKHSRNSTPRENRQFTYLTKLTPCPTVPPSGRSRRPIYPPSASRLSAASISAASNRNC